MPWFRVYPEITNDPKIKMAARKLGVPYATALGYWITLLSAASESPERGQLLIAEEVPYTTEDIAALLGLSAEESRNVSETFQSVSLLESINDVLLIGAWDKRQFKSDNVSERVREHRRNVSETFQPPHGETGQKQKQSTEAEVQQQQQQLRHSADCPKADSDPVSQLIQEFDAMFLRPAGIGTKERKEIARIIDSCGYEALRDDMRDAKDRGENPPHMRFFLGGWRKNPPDRISANESPKEEATQFGHPILHEHGLRFIQDPISGYKLTYEAWLTELGFIAEDNKCGREEAEKLYANGVRAV